MLQASLHRSGATLNLPYHALIPDHHTIALALTVAPHQRLQPTDHTCLASQLPRTKAVIRPPMLLAQAFRVHCTPVLTTHRILPIEMTGEVLRRHQTQNLSSLKLPKSLNAGSMAVTVANFLHSAIFLGTSGRSLERHRNPSATVVAQSSLGKQHATAIWPTTNASHAPLLEFDTDGDDWDFGIGIVERSNGIAWKLEVLNITQIYKHRRSSALGLGLRMPCSLYF